MKKVIKILLILVVVGILLIAGGIFYLTRGLDEGTKVVINELNLSEVEDGVYRGNYDHGRWTTVVEVTVENHKIIDIKMIDDVTFVKPGVSDEIFNKVVEEQSTQVEIVSGSTITSKAYLKAIEDALNK